jgi:hypothetical protein
VVQINVVVIIDFQNLISPTIENDNIVVRVFLNIAYVSIIISPIPIRGNKVIDHDVGTIVKDGDEYQGCVAF